MPPKQKIPDLGELGRLLTERLKAAPERPTIYGYMPHAKQLEFHSAVEQSRLYIGGNRGGKTVGGVVEDIWWLTGEHPYRETPRPPIRGRVVVVDFNEGLEKILMPELLRWLPPSKLKNGSWEQSYNKRLRTLTLENGSFVEFMSYEQDTEKFAGTSRHFIHYDEEPPKSIFTECSARLVDTRGSFWITMTPLDGMESFIYDQLFLPGQIPGSGIKVVQVEMTDNPYISPVEAERFLSTVEDPQEREARKSGTFQNIGGGAFKAFKPDIHVIPSDIIKLAPMHEFQYASMDHGFNAPTAWYYTYITNGIAITWDELYQAETTVPEWANTLHARNRQPGRRAPDIYVGDPAIKQRSAQTGHSIQALYAQNGIPIVLGNNDQLYGVNKMNNYLKSLKWFITDACPTLIQQLQRVRWDTWASSKIKDRSNVKETLHKHNDHATDAMRYLFSILPDIVPTDELNKMKKLDLTKFLERLLSPARGARPGEVYDVNFAKQGYEDQYPSTEWKTVDEHLGGIW